MITSVLLAILLSAAVWADFTSHRIPNGLSVAAAVLGLGLSLAPEGIGIGEAGGGFAAGFVALLPLYLFRAVGAGDLKLMAAAGTFLGTAGTLVALVYALALGGPLVLGYAAKKRSLARLLDSLRVFTYGSAIRVSHGSAPSVDDMPLSGLRVPYAIAIAGGVLLQQLTQHLGGAGA